MADAIVEVPGQCYTCGRYEDEHDAPDYTCGDFTPLV